MPSLTHEILVMLFRERPSLAPELLRDVLGTQVPAYDDITLADANLSQIMPTELRADLVVLLEAGEPVLGIVLEVQLRRTMTSLSCGRCTWRPCVLGTAVPAVCSS